MTFNYNGNYFNETDALFGKVNRAFLYGDFISELVKVSEKNILLWEDHYFNLMASMRIFRMKIPISFTQEFLQDEVLKVLKENNLSNTQIRISVFRNVDSDDLLTKSSISYLIEVVKQLPSDYIWYNHFSEIEIFKDFTVNPDFFSQVNSHKPEEIIAKAYLQENEFQDLVLLNPDKKIARTLFGSPFLIQGNTVKAIKISEGGIRSVTRNHLCKILEKTELFDFEETDVFPFELQKTDEIFVCLESEGISSIHQNRKKVYKTEKTKEIVGLLNSELKLEN